MPGSLVAASNRNPFAFMDDLIRPLSEFAHWLPLVGAVLALLMALWAAIRLRVSSVLQRGILQPMNISGGRIARQLLDRNGMANVEILPAKRGMGESYRSDLRALFISENNFRSHSPVAVAVAIHETGHAIQIKRQHWDIAFRFLLLQWTPLVAGVAWMGFLAGFVWTWIGGAPGWAVRGGWLGGIALGVLALLHLLTLRVEHRAAHRPLHQLGERGLMDADQFQRLRPFLNTLVVAESILLMPFLAIFCPPRLTAEPGMEDPGAGPATGTSTGNP